MAEAHDRTAIAIAQTPAVAPKMKLATSLARAQRDEFVYVGKQGEIRSPARYQAHQGVAFGISIGAALLGTGLCFAAGLPALSLLYLSAIGIVGHSWKTSSQLKRGAALLAAERFDEARTTLESLIHSRFTPRPARALAWHNLAGVATRQGHHARALDHARRCQQELDRVRFAPVGPWRWINRFALVQLLAQNDQIDLAKDALEDLTQAPQGEYFKILRMNAELMVAFVDDDPSRLPKDLFPWCRIALETTTAELALTLLAWAYLRRNDTDMGQHLLSEAFERVEPRTFAPANPAVYAWLRSQHRPSQR